MVMRRSSASYLLAALLSRQIHIPPQAHLKCSVVANSIAAGTKRESALHLM